MLAGFLKRLSLFPNNNALFIADRYYTYQQLWQIVLAVYQRIPSVKTFQYIGVYCNDDVASYASILAVNLYGAAYVPLNSKSTISKNKNIVGQCALELIIASVESSALEKIGENTELLFISGSDIESVDSFDESNVVKHHDYLKVNQPTAYILFTSGSTGEPKGVPVSHLNTNSFFNFYLNNYGFNDKDKFLQVYEPTFDVSVFSFFMPLMVGACCYVLPADGIRYMKTVEYLQKYHITVVSMVPTVLRYLENYLKDIRLPELRYSFFSGDALYHDLAVSWSKAIPNAMIHNFYGPTETTIVCTRYVFDEQKSANESVNGIVPLGEAFPEMETVIVDENNKPTKKGELCFTGAQVISAYLNNTNEEQFFEHDGKRFYKTGDLASMNENGNLLFHGRTDSQVKVNGYRVELAEVENAITKVLGNVKAVVLCVKNEKGVNELFVFLEKIKIDKKKWVHQLSELLPNYMIPNQFISIDTFVLTENGKIDKQSLLDFM